VNHRRTIPELAADLERIAVELRMHHQGAAVVDGPRDGEIRDGRIWVRGHWLHLTEQGRKLLAFAIGAGTGASWEAVAEYMTWNGEKVVRNSIGKFNEMIRKELKGSQPRPLMRFHGGGLACEWLGAAADSKETA
jgi:hypothetical protein